jgi:hypothetical protein
MTFRPVSYHGIFTLAESGMDVPLRAAPSMSQDEVEQDPQQVDACAVQTHRASVEASSQAAYREKAA